MSFYYYFIILYLNSYLVYNLVLIIIYESHNNIFTSNYPFNFKRMIQTVLNLINNHTKSMKYNYDYIILVST
jgi:hypothetical protein